MRSRLDRDRKFAASRMTAMSEERFAKRIRAGSGFVCVVIVRGMPDGRIRFGIRKRQFALTLREIESQVRFAKRNSGVAIFPKSLGRIRRISRLTEDSVRGRQRESSGSSVVQ